LKKKNSKKRKVGIKSEQKQTRRILNSVLGLISTSTVCVRKADKILPSTIKEVPFAPVNYPVTKKVIVSVYQSFYLILFFFEEEKTKKCTIYEGVCVYVCKLYM
jgi:hypothetical protein